MWSALSFEDAEFDVLTGLANFFGLPHHFFMHGERHTPLR